MNKKIFCSFLCLTSALLSPSLAKAAQVSITMDDFDIDEEAGLTAAQRNEHILATLKKHHAHAALFVIGKYIRNDRDRKLLNAWSEAGHLIGNHTFEHQGYFADRSFDDEKADVLKAEAILQNVKGFKKFFRFPMLAEGNTVQKRDQMRAWLRDHHYTVGSVTIDTSDWYLDWRLRERLLKEPNADLKPYRDYYLNHLWDRANYYNDLAKRVLGREVKHTLLVHFNLLEALFLDDALTMFESHGWKIIDAEKAFRDPIFHRLPNSMPSGQSIIWGLAKESGRFENELRYPGEGDTYEKPKLDALGL